MVRGVVKKKTMTNVRGQRLTVITPGSTATDGCLNRRLKSPSLQNSGIGFGLILVVLQSSQAALARSFPGRPHVWKGSDVICGGKTKQPSNLIKDSVLEKENPCVSFQGVTHPVNNQTRNGLVCYSPSCDETPRRVQ